MSHSVISTSPAATPAKIENVAWCTHTPRHDAKWRHQTSSGKSVCKHSECRAKRAAQRGKVREDEEATAKRRKLATVSEASAAVSEASAAVVYNPVALLLHVTFNISDACTYMCTLMLVIAA